MNFLRIGRSLCRSSCSKNTFFRGGGRSAVLNGGLLQTPRSASCPSGFDGKLGFLRGHFVSVRPHKQFSTKTSLPDVNRILANPKVHRFFSSEAPEEKNKNYEEFCAEEKMEIPKGDDQKLESKGYLDDERGLRELDFWLTAITIFYLGGLAFTFYGLRELKKIPPQYFFEGRFWRREKLVEEVEVKPDESFVSSFTTVRKK